MAFVNVDVDACLPQVRVGLKDGKRQCYSAKTVKVLLGLSLSLKEVTHLLNS